MHIVATLVALALLYHIRKSDFARAMFFMLGLMALALVISVAVHSVM